MARKFNDVWWKKARCLGVLAIFKQALVPVILLDSPFAQDLQNLFTFLFGNIGGGEGGCAAHGKTPESKRLLKGRRELVAHAV